MLPEYNLVKKNRSFTPTMRMADLIHTDYHLIPIIGHFDIEYGFGNKTVKEVCDANSINVWFFLEIINSFHNSQYFPSQELQNFNTSLIIQYLLNTHRFYSGTKIPEIEEYINEMERQLTKDGSRNVKLLSGFFKNYKEELQNHFQTEEDMVFPYVMALETAVENGTYEEELFTAIATDPVMKFERNHNSLESNLSDLKNLIIRHLPPLVCRELCQKLLTEREIEVLCKVAQGKANKEIADKLFISINTVITHRKNITEKLGIKTIAGLTVYAIMNGIINPEEVKY
ncbi:MAG: LuxR C-terminal-related transcriptional regulator [Bacteroidales bacterium]|nr:LuxR C-terminal-related transcriptional regulator [Bacteroidales bacterium]